MKGHFFLLLALFAVASISCDESTVRKNETIVNSFEMKVDDRTWQPAQISDCEQMFSCAMSKLGESRFYQIKAYKDPSLSASIDSENYLEIKVMDVNKEGTYYLNEGFGDFKSYARFTMNGASGKKIYQNNDQNDFQLSVREFVFHENSDLVGIIGAFSGFLYNIDDSNDFIEIKEGEFVFKHTNNFDFWQCIGR